MNSSISNNNSIVKPIFIYDKYNTIIFIYPSQIILIFNLIIDILKKIKYIYI